MNALFLYGAPATGKLTIAQELARLTGYAVFHNHLTRDLVRDLYPGKVMEHYDLVDMLREDVLRYCARHETNLIFTFVYDGPEEDEVVAKRVQSITDNGGNVYFTELTAPSSVLLDRVANESRKQHKKLTDREQLAALLTDKAYPSVPYEQVLKIDTSIMPPPAAAKVIAEQFSLM